MIAAFWHVVAQAVAPAAQADVFPHQEVGAKIVEQITGQSDLLHSLAVAVCGGTLALLWSLVQHNLETQAQAGQKGAVLKLKHKNWLMAGLISVGVSVLCAYGLRGLLVSEVPRLMGLTYYPKTSFDRMDGVYPAGTWLGMMAVAQWVLFTGGTVILFVVFLRNFLPILSEPHHEPERSGTHEHPPQKPQVLGGGRGIDSGPADGSR